MNIKYNNIEAYHKSQSQHLWMKIYLFDNVLPFLEKIKIQMRNTKKIGWK